MKTTKLFFMAALALMTAACSNDDNDLTQQPAKAEGIPFTATISLDQSATTRALTENGTTIEATWATGEKVALIYTVSATTYVKEAEVTPQGDGTATISTTLEGSPADDTDVTIVYPASAVDGTTKDVKTNLLASQNGLLTGTGSIAEKYELRKTTTPAKLKIDGTTASLKGTVTLTNLIAIFKFTLQDLSAAAKSATEFKVSANSGYVITTVTPGSASDVLYVALPEMVAGTYWFNATIDSKPYIAKATTAAATVAGKYYQTTVKMATVGDLIGQDGKFYADAAAITAASTTAIGVIAHIGTDATTEAIANGGGHGLVLCLKNAASGDDAQWSTETSAFEFGEDAKVADVTALKRTTNVSGYTNTKTLAEKTEAATKYKAAYAAKNYTGLTAPTGTTGWFLPSAQQWVKMIEGLGGLTDGAPSWASWFDNSHTGATAWEAALSKAGSGNYDSMSGHQLYWSSSECSAAAAVYLSVDTTRMGVEYGFSWGGTNKDNTYSRDRVRPVLAF